MTTNGHLYSLLQIDAFTDIHEWMQMDGKFLMDHDHDLHYMLAGEHLRINLLTHVGFLFLGFFI